MPGGVIAIALAWAVAVAIAGCAGNGEGLDENGRPIDENPPPADDAFTQIQDTILTPHCTVCHAGASAPLGLRLDAANSYAMLVDVASVENPALDRVEPGDPDASFLVQKIEGTAGFGGRMPLGAAPLSVEETALIRQWIVDGAAAPEAQGDGEAPRLASSVPADGEFTAGAPREILMIFDRPLDANLVLPDMVSLRTEMASVDIAVRANARVLRVVPTVALRDGRYRLCARGSGSLALADPGGQVIDGDACIAFIVEGAP